jgi:hypothetical protein
LMIILVTGNNFLVMFVGLVFLLGRVILWNIIL